MTPKFRAYDGGSLNRMYQPDEVMVGNGDSGLRMKKSSATSTKTQSFWRTENETL